MLPAQQIKIFARFPSPILFEKQAGDDFLYSKNFQLGELFCGPGGIAYGAITAHIAGHPDVSISHAWANDIDPATCETYRSNICPNNPGSVLCRDVHELDIEHDPFFWQHPFNAFAFGFPCNDFSLVGEQKGFNGKYGPLYTYGIRILKAYQPLWFLAENVSGITSANDGNAFQKILGDMSDAGYRIYPHLYKFEEYGVPQARHRVIIIGIREDQNATNGVPLEFFPTKPITPVPSEYKTCKEAIENPPISANAANNELPRMSDKTIERLSLIGEGENVFNAHLLKNRPDLQLKVKGATISQIYRRLDSKKPSYTITGSGGGGTHVYHWEEPRALTNRERARLQTFPDTFIFHGTKEQVRRQIGMAVPCDGVRQIFEAILKTFAGIPYPCVDCNIPFQRKRGAVA